MRGRRIGMILVLACFLLWGLAGAGESGTESTPRLVHDFFPGEFGPDSPLERLTQVDDTLFFIAGDLESGRRLWRTENGGSGIQRVQVQGRAEQAGDDHDIVGRMGQFLLWTVRPAEDPDAAVLLSTTVQGDGIPLHSYRQRGVDSVAIAGNRFFFQDCTDGGCDVWSTDGTVAGTRAVSTVNTRFSGEPLQISGTFADRWLLLRGRQDLFAYDFVADRIQLLLPGYAQRAHLYPTGNSLFILVTPAEAAQRVRLFASRLEAPRAVQVFEDSVTIDVAGARAGRLYFSAGPGRLWSSDGRPEGTRSYSGIRSNLELFSNYVDQLGSIGSKILIPMPGYYLGGLLGVDEAEGEVRMLKTFCSSRYVCRGLRMSPITYTGGKAFESVNDRLWQSDGTREGTRLAEIFSKVKADSFLGLNGRLLLGGTSRDGVEQLWETDGTAAGTRALSDGTPDRPFRVQSPPVPLSGGLLVVAERKPLGKQLWRVADGSTTSLTSLRHQGIGIHPFAAVPLGNRVVIKGANANWRAAGEDGSAERLPLDDGDCAVPVSCAAERVVVGQRLLLVTDRLELWSSDGTAAGSGAVPLTGEDGDVAEVAALGRLGGQGLALDHLGGLWTSDGTPSGTRLFARLPVDSSLAYEPVGPPVPVGSRSFLFRRVAPEDPEASASLEIWCTNGTQAGTLLLATTPFPFDFISYLSPAVVAGRLFFRFGGTLWVSDGSAAGTHPLENQLPGETFTLIAGTDTLYAGAGYQDEDLEHQALWAVNPQTLEASLVGTFFYVGGGAVGTTLGSVFGNTLFFQAPQERGIKPRWWVTEGTAVSTHLVPGLLPRNQVTEFFNVAGRRYFRSCEAEHGCELWSTDRLGEDLRLVADVWPGQGSGDPEILAVDGNTIWFAATVPSVGRELWKIDVSAVP